MDARAQPSIRSFFQPRQQPSYTTPPSLPIAESTVHPSGGVTTSKSAAREPVNKSAIPAQAFISLISQSHIQPLRRINALLLPVPYPDSFYHQILSPNPPISFSRVVSWSDNDTKVIGGIVCRLDPAVAPDSTPQAPKFIPNSYDIYIQSLALLSPYRGKGLATSLLNTIITAATAQDQVRIESLYAHVWTENNEALEWYAAREFEPEGAVIDGYYRRLNPGTAYIFRRRLDPSDHFTALQNSQSAPTPTKIDTSRTPFPNTLTRPAPPLSARSFQDQGPEREWNDPPEDVLGNTLLKPKSRVVSEQGSAASSRNSSQTRTAKDKKKRAYPAAAFQ